MIFQNTSLLKNKDAIFLIFFSHFFVASFLWIVGNQLLSMASSSKRKRVVLSIEDKSTVCDLVRKKVSYSEINNRLNIGKPTISDIVRGEEKLKKFKQSKCELGISKSVKKTKTVRGGKLDKLDQVMYIWVH